MKRRDLIVLGILVLPIAFMLVVGSYFHPFSYTYIFGDSNTKRLYELYRYAQDNSERSTIEHKMEQMNLSYTYNDKKHQIVAGSNTRADAVYITFEGNAVVDVQFSPD